MKRILSDEFLGKYGDKPDHMSPMSNFVFSRTYSRWLESERRRETFKEAIARAVDYSMNIALNRYTELGYMSDEQNFVQVQAEAEALFDNIFNLNQFLSGRTHWVGGADTGIAEKFPMSNFNCAFTRVKKLKDITEIFYLLLIGSGVGVRLSKEDLETFPLIRTDYELMHSEFKPMKKEERIEKTKVVVFDNSFAKIYVGDSKEGWIQALEHLFELITLDEYRHIKHIKISYNSIRPRGEKLKTFGGTASGYEPLKDMFSKIDKVVKGKLDNKIAKLEEVNLDGIIYHKLRTIHILDTVCSLGENVVVGGVRRTALMIGCDEDDYEVINAKKEFWKYPELSHRAMSNNSIYYKDKPELENLKKVLESTRVNGEPGIVNEVAGLLRRPAFNGVNPCGEILLDNKGLCNLTTINVVSAIKYVDDVPVLDISKLARMQKLSVRASMRMILLTLEMPEWDRVHKRDSLIGASLTGWKDAMDILGYNESKEKDLLGFLLNIARQEAVTYSATLRTPLPLLTTTVKPEGTLSQVANGVSSGLHYSYAPYYIRRIRINANDPLVGVVKELGWIVNPEVGTIGETFEEKVANATTLVIDFPVKSGSTKFSKDLTAMQQLDNYFMFQEHYTEHNSSVTIYVADDEWEDVAKMIHERWDDFVGVSFLPKDNHNYELAPYEEITEEEYIKLSSEMKDFDIRLLQKYEFGETERDEVNIKSCDSGMCPL